jgi:hypothetical protein
MATCVDINSPPPSSVQKKKWILSRIDSSILRISTTEEAQTRTLNLLPLLDGDVIRVSTRPCAFVRHVMITKNGRTRTLQNHLSGSFPHPPTSSYAFSPHPPPSYFTRSRSFILFSFFFGFQPGCLWASLVATRIKNPSHQPYRVVACSFLRQIGV